ncbi:hypothetical protein CGRA01v4_06307 [Colletotrichum graminicola]|nr:hypothetical protein CGRA01v4_06307 [Colletotrichum graminicola]
MRARRNREVHRCTTSPAVDLRVCGCILPTRRSTFGPVVAEMRAGVQSDIQSGGSSEVKSRYKVMGETRSSWSDQPCGLFCAREEGFVAINSDL